MFEYLCGSAVLGQNQGMFELPQDLVYMLASCREMGNPSARSVNFEVFWGRNRKFLVFRRERHSSLVVWEDVS